MFPILNTEDENKAYSQYEIALNYYNRQLKRLSKLLEPNINLSSYTPRHTWATTARNKMYLCQSSVQAWDIVRKNHTDLFDKDRQFNYR